MWKQNVQQEVITFTDLVSLTFTFPPPTESYVYSYDTVRKDNAVVLAKNHGDSFAGSQRFTQRKNIASVSLKIYDMPYK